MAHLKNKLNNYAEAVTQQFYDATPKAVWAALAVSALTMGGDYIEGAEARVLGEWDALCANGIVPQRPPKRAEGRAE